VPARLRVRDFYSRFSGVEGRIVFRYANTSKLDALIDRRNNEDVIWRKTKRTAEVKKDEFP
jgi:hypothetical protein